MLNLDAYNGKDIQNCISILEQYAGKSAGIGLVSRELRNYIINSSIKNGIDDDNNKRRLVKCPSCEDGSMIGPYNVGILVVRCSKKCGYSEVDK